MIFDVILVKQADDGYLARPVLWPDTVVHGATEQEALDRVRSVIRDLLGRTRMIQVDVEGEPPHTTHPWQTKAGLFADDPSWDEFLEAMADYRRRLEASTAAST